jgi:phosphatidylserine synthase
MKKYIYYTPHVLTLAGLAFAALAALAIIGGDYRSAARLSLLVLLIDHLDGTLARKFKSKEKFPGTSGEVLDIITDLVGLTFVPMLLFRDSGLFLPQMGTILMVTAVVAASWKYSRKEGFLKKGYSVGAPPVFFSLFLFYFLRLPPVYPTFYCIVLTILVLSPVRYPITSMVTTHWKPGYKSVSNYLTAVIFVPAFIMLEQAPSVIYWVMLAAVGIQLFIYPALLGIGVFKPVFDRKY